MTIATDGREADTGAPLVAPVLALDGVHAGYGQFQALFGLSLEVAPGHALAIVFIDVAGHDFKLVAGLFEKFSAAEGAAGQDQAV